MIALLLVLIFQATSAPQSSISGTVMDAVAPDVAPLYIARVELAKDSGLAMVQRVDEYGRFAFPNLGSGKYRLSVTCDGFIRKTQNITIAAGEQKKDIRFALDKAPTIFGRIRDPYNIPLDGILVEAIKVVYGPRGDRSLVTLESALSDDRGEYHLYWLDPGDYYIRASSVIPKQDQASNNTAPPDPRAAAAAPSIYAPTFYPGFRDPKDATLIRLRVGSNLTGFDFKLQPTSVINLLGHINIEATGEGVAATITAAPAGAVASVQKYEAKSAAGPRVPIREWGEFRINGMLPGTYVFSAPYSLGGQQLMVHRKFTIKTIEPAFILLLTPGSTVSGKISVDSDTIPDLRTVHVSLDSVDPDMPSPKIASVDAKGQFAADRVEPGDYALRIFDLPGDVYVKSARSGDDDILSKPLRLKFAAPAPVNIVLGTDGSRLDGVVVDNANRPFADAQVVLVPDAARRNSPEQFRPATSDDAGRFTLRGIPPGDYKLFAWQSMEPNAYLNANVLQGYENLGLAFTVPANSAGSTSVRVIPTD